MPGKSIFSHEFKKLGAWLYSARLRQGLSQQELALRAGIAQPNISGIEQGLRLPTYPQLLRLARAPGVPLQWFLNGATTPGTETQDLTLELQHFGVVDLLAPQAPVPGAFRPTEQVLALAVQGSQPDPRIIEAIPAVLAWNPWYPPLLRAYARRQGPSVNFRLAWLADVALTIHQAYGFPGGCPERRRLEAAVRVWTRAFSAAPPGRDDDLGRPASGEGLPPVWKRWRIRYDAPLTSFLDRARHLESFRAQRRSGPDLSQAASDE